MTNTTPTDRTTTNRSVDFTYGAAQHGRRKLVPAAVGNDKVGQGSAGLHAPTDCQRRRLPEAWRHIGFMERPKKLENDPLVASAMDHVLAAEHRLRDDIESIKGAAAAQLDEARLLARHILERAEQRTADVHRRGKRLLEREIAELKREAAAETPSAEPEPQMLSRMRDAAASLAARLTSREDGH